MEFFETAAKRHSYRKEFLKKPVFRSDLEKIVQAGIMAPSGKNEQTTSFIIVDEPELLAKIRTLVKRPVMDTAPALIIVCSRKIISYAGHEFEKEDYSAAVENMLLAITAMSMASVWLDGVLRINQISEQIGGLFHLPENVKVSVVLPVGYPAEILEPAVKKDFSQRAAFNRFPG